MWACKILIERGGARQAFGLRRGSRYETIRELYLDDSYDYGWVWRDALCVGLSYWRGDGVGVLSAG